MRHTVNSLSSVIGAYYRSQSEEVKRNIRRAVGIVFPEEPKVNMSKGIITEKKASQNYICLNCKEIYPYEPVYCNECGCRFSHKTFTLV